MGIVSFIYMYIVIENEIIYLSVIFFDIYMYIFISIYHMELSILMMYLPTMRSLSIVMKTWFFCTHKNVNSKEESVDMSRCSIWSSI